MIVFSNQNRKFELLNLNQPILEFSMDKYNINNYSKVKRTKSRKHRSGLKFHNFVADCGTSIRANNLNSETTHCLKEEHGTKQITVSHWRKSNNSLSNNSSNNNNSSKVSNESELESKKFKKNELTDEIFSLNSSVNDKESNANLNGQNNLLKNQLVIENATSLNAYPYLNGKQKHLNLKTLQSTSKSYQQLPSSSNKFQPLLMSSPKIKSQNNKTSLNLNKLNQLKTLNEDFYLNQTEKKIDTNLNQDSILSTLLIKQAEQEQQNLKLGDKSKHSKSNLGVSRRKPIFVRRLIKIPVKNDTCWSDQEDANEIDLDKLDNQLKLNLNQKQLCDLICDEKIEQQQPLDLSIKKRK